MNACLPSESYERVISSLVPPPKYNLKSCHPRFQPSYFGFFEKIKIHEVDSCTFELSLFDRSRTSVDSYRKLRWYLFQKFAQRTFKPTININSGSDYAPFTIQEVKVLSRVFSIGTISLDCVQVGDMQELVDLMVSKSIRVDTSYGFKGESLLSSDQITKLIFN